MALPTIWEKDPGEQLEIGRIGEIHTARFFRCEPAKLDVLRVSEIRLRPRPAANQEDVIHAWTMRFGVGFRRRFEEREFRRD